MFKRNPEDPDGWVVNMFFVLPLFVGSILGGVVLALTH